MQETLELLREHCESHSFPMELPTEDDLLDIHEQLLLHIPYQLREFLLNASDIVLGSLEPVTASDPQMHTYLPEVAAQAWEQGLPRHLMPLCVNGTDYYAVAPDDEVLTWCAIKQDFLDQSWESVWDWAHDYWLASAQRASS